MRKTRPLECPRRGETIMSDVAPSHVHDEGVFVCREIQNPRLPAEPLDALEAQVDKLEPLLRQRLWYPMTYMMIPSILSSADRLLLELEGYTGPEPERAKKLHARLLALRTGFRRDPCPPAGAARSGGEGASNA
jgi:hypothetical protein